MSENFRFVPYRLLLSVLILRPCLSYNPKQELVSKFLDYDSQVSSRSASMIPDESFTAVVDFDTWGMHSIGVGHKVAFAHYTQQTLADEPDSLCEYILFSQFPGILRLSTEIGNRLPRTLHLGWCAGLRNLLKNAEIVHVPFRHLLCWGFNNSIWSQNWMIWPRSSKGEKAFCAAVSSNVKHQVLRQLPTQQFPPKWEDRFPPESSTKSFSNYNFVKKADQHEQRRHRHSKQLRLGTMDNRRAASLRAVREGQSGIFH